jgi:uncharacterized protein (DUF305 family)
MILAAAVLTACSAAMQSASQAGAPSGGALTPAEQAKADKGIEPYTTADVNFMQGMIHHHSQAILMAGWARSHGASPAVAEVCDRIIVAQRDEIVFMQRWLNERHLNVPKADTTRATGMAPMQGMSGMADMPGMGGQALMPGMLTRPQLVALDSTRGKDFDRLFLTDMIQHHEGAISMVTDLFDSYGAAQDDIIFKFASDVNADQTAEVDRMSRMLAAMTPAASGQE